MNVLSEQGNQPNGSEDRMQEATRVIPAVGKTEPPVRRRRADRYRAESQMAEEPGISLPGESGAEESSRMILESTHMPPAPQRTTPRPQALERTERARESRGDDIRRPVNAPGYSRRAPLGYDPEADAIHTGRMEEKRHYEDNEVQKPGKSRILVGILIAILILALLVLGIHLIPEDNTSVLGDVKRTVTGALSGILPAQPTSVPTSEPEPIPEDHPVTASAQSGVAPLEVIYTFETSDDIEEVRILDAQNVEMDYLTKAEGTESGLKWTITVTYADAYEGEVQIQTLYDGEWNDFGERIPMQISEAAPVLEQSAQAPVAQNSNLVMDFSATPRTGTAPINVAFSMTTSLSATDIRLVNEQGEVLDAVGTVLVENKSTPQRIWAMNMMFEEAYSGMVVAQVKSEDRWIDSDKSITLNIAANPLATQVPMTSDVPEILPEDTQEPEGEAQPTNEPAVTTQEPVAPVPIGAEQTDPWEEGPWDDSGDATDAADGDAFLEEQDTSETAEATETAAVITPAVTTVLPEATEAPQPTEVPAEETLAPTEAPRLQAVADESADPSLIKTATIYNGNSAVNTYDRPIADLIDMPDADHYALQPYGVMTFRGSSFRQNAAEGTVSSDLTGMDILWQTDAGSAKGASSTFYGIGWTGQPLIIKWSKEIREMSNLNEAKKNTKALREVIVAGEDGKIYFLDLETGEATRDVIQLGYPMRGTPSVHALGYPLMSVGQYARKMSGRTGDIGLRVYNLLTQKQAFMIDGLDGRLGRPYYGVGSFETSSLFDYHSDSMISAGTNGMLYVTKLNTTVNRTQSTLSTDSQQVALRTKVSKQADKLVAVESSLAAYQKYVFYADMAGILRCVDTTSMTTVWAVDTDDSVEAAIALDLDDAGNLWLYTANTLQQRSKGDCSIRRYNAMTGKLDWQYDIPVSKATKKHNIIGGAKASPVIGRKGLDGLVYFTICSAKDVRGAAAESVLIALDKTTGEVAWLKTQDVYTYSSPVAVYTDTGKGYLIQATSDGKLYLMDGLTGEQVSMLQLEGTVNASPAVYKDTLVIGTQGKGTSHIYGITLR